MVNGPEILDKYVGEAEKNIRMLFKDAEDEWAVGSPTDSLSLSLSRYICINIYTPFPPQTFSFHFPSICNIHIYIVMHLYFLVDQR